MRTGGYLAQEREPHYKSAKAHLADYLLKAPGDRGGHVIGTTARGNPIYAETSGTSAAYNHLSPQEHAAAAALHDRMATDADSIRSSTHHTAMADSHRQAYGKSVEKQNRLTPAQKLQQKLKYSIPEEKPTEADGRAMGKVFSGRVVYSHRPAHHYEAMTAAEHGEMSVSHAKAAERAKATGNEAEAAHHGQMRYHHVQAAMSQAKIEAKNHPGQEERRFRRPNDGRRHWGS